MLPATKHSNRLLSTDSVQVDIALDTFPYSNTTTACESLLMGVPAVTLVGNTHGSRVTRRVMPWHTTCLCTDMHRPKYINLDYLVHDLKHFLFSLII
eukprot:Skav209858  [mRNA]  locus=scaffold1684:226476:227543:+ [translate_table: standard]